MKTRQVIVEFPQYISEIHHQLQQDEIFSLHKPAKAFYIFAAFAKSEAERGNSNNLQLANISTPLTLKRAFFVRSLRTPKENTAPQNRERGSLPMVAFGGKGFALCCFPLMTVFEPVKRYRQSLESEAIALFNFSGAIKMLFKFLLLGEKRLTVRICANTEAEARQRIQFTSPAICVARLPLPMNRFKAQGGVYA